LAYFETYVSGFAQRLARLAKSRTARDSYVVISGNLLTAALGFLSMMIIIRALGPRNFGLFSVATAVMTLTVGLADLGIGTALVRFAASYLAEDQRKANLVFRVAFNIEVVLSLLVLIVGVAVAGPLASLISSEKELASLLRLAFLGAAAMSMGSYITAVLQAWQSFTKLAVYSVLSNILKLLLIVVLVSVGYLRVFNSIAVYALVPVLGLFLGMVLIPKQFLREKNLTGSRDAFRGLFSFGKWIMLSYLANSIVTRVDVLLLSRFKGVEAVGIYSAGYQLSMIFPILIGSLVTVLLPQVSKLNYKNEFVFFVKKSLSMSTIILIALLPVLFFSRYLIELFWGASYLSSVGVFNILFITFMINLFFNPISTVLYALDKPRIITFTNLLQLGISIAGNLFLIPLYGIYGVAYTFFGLTAVGSIIIAAFVASSITKLPLNKHMVA
jgi:O-antigen/teichoic acid export membrane protein